MVQPITSERLTPGQRKQLRRLVEDATDSVCVELTKKRAQRLIGRGGELKAGILGLARIFSLGQFADEEVVSSYEYPQTYQPRPVPEQVEILRQLLPELAEATFDESILTRDLPGGAEAYFAVPRWEKLGQSYGEALERILAAIGSSRTFCNYRKGCLGSAYLRQSARTAELFQRLSEQQAGYDILVVSCQFGLSHRGRSVRRALELMEESEAGLSAFAVACMLLTHPERLATGQELWIDCAGDEYSDGGDGRFGRAPCFGFSMCELGFGASYVGYAGGRYGSASVLLPQ